MKVQRSLAAGAVGGAIAGVAAVGVDYAWLSHNDGVLKSFILAWTAMKAIGLLAAPVGALAGVSLLLPYMMVRRDNFSWLADCLAFVLVGAIAALPAHIILNFDSNQTTIVDFATTSVLCAIGSLAGVWPFRFLLGPPASRPSRGAL